MDSAAVRVLALKSRLDPRPPLSPDSALERLLAPRAVDLAHRLTRPGGPLAAVAGLRPAEPADAGLDPSGLARLDSILDRGLEDSLFTAAAVAVARRGSLVLLRGYGEDVDPAETVFDIASLTKVVGTATAAALLVERGVLDLDAPVQRHVPEFSGEGKASVTVRHLLTHTSGLPSGIWLYGSARSPAQALRQVLEQRLLTEPGERVLYSDLGMILLAEIVARAGGLPIDFLLARDVFAPLGMERTSYLPPAALHPGIIPTAARTEREFVLRGVVHDANAFRLGGVAGHAGLFSTARDLAVFAQMMLDQGRYGSVRILSAETATAFTTRQPGAETRALGWDTPSDRSTAGRFFSARSFGHTGYTGTSLWIDPEQELFVVLLTNRTFTEASASEIRDLRAALHDAAARAITDAEIRPRPGAR